jgi:hypothetical protein
MVRDKLILKYHVLCIKATPSMVIVVFLIDTTLIATNWFSDQGPLT